MERRHFVKTGLAGAAALGLAPTAAPPLRRRINHSVCRWCYRGLTVEELAQAAVRIGISSVELLEPHEWPIIKEYGLTCAMPFGPVAEGKNRLTDGFNEPANHEWLIPMFTERIAEVADAGYDRVICFSGNRRGMADDLGMEHCIKGLAPLMPIAEAAGVTLCMELLNSKVDHADYMCDRTAWGVELAQGVRVGPL